MKTYFASIVEVVCVIGSVALLGCGSSSSPNTGEDAGGDSAARGSQIPPTGTQSAIEAWLATGAYKSWHCDTIRAGKSPSPHGQQRVCSNDKESAWGTGEYPVGSAAVKELYDTAGTKIIGYAVENKVATGGGDAWYWYERSGTMLVANGPGSSGAPMTICVSCHSMAGSAEFGHDFVFTQVK